MATPEQALADGADLLVIGRPITGPPDPGAAAAGIAASLRRTGAAWHTGRPIDWPISPRRTPAPSVRFGDVEARTFN